MFHFFFQIEDCAGWHRDVLPTRSSFADFPLQCSSPGRGACVVPLRAHNGRLQVPDAKLSRGRQCLHLWLVGPYHRELNLETIQRKSTGFSRGAYTARALAGMLHKVIFGLPICYIIVPTNFMDQVGLLSKDNLEQVHFAFKLYKSSNHGTNKLAVRFKRAFSREVPIEFLGVWSVSLPYAPSFRVRCCLAGTPLQVSGSLAVERSLS
jgi:hypothetical protein